MAPPFSSVTEAIRSQRNRAFEFVSLLVELTMNRERRREPL